MHKNPHVNMVLNTHVFRNSHLLADLYPAIPPAMNRLDVATRASAKLNGLPEPVLEEQESEAYQAMEAGAQAQAGYLHAHFIDGANQ